jgi:hypothetical protein
MIKLKKDKPVTAWFAGTLKTVLGRKEWKMQLNHPLSTATRLFFQSPLSPCFSCSHFCPKKGEEIFVYVFVFMVVF